MTDLFGEPISTYTEEQGIEDGVFAYPFPDKFPGVLLTSAVHEAICDKIEPALEARLYEQAVIPLLIDAVMIVNSDLKEHLFTKELEGNVTGQELWIARNGMNGFTIMFPSDY